MIWLIINPLLLMIILWLVDRNNAELDFRVLFIVCAVVGLLSFFVNIFLTDKIGYGTLLVNGAIAWFAIAKFCYTTVIKATVVTFLYILAQLAVLIVLIEMLQLAFKV